MLTRFIKTVLFSILFFVVISMLQSCDKKETVLEDIGKRTFEIKYYVEVKDIPRDSNQIKIWIPVPVDRKAQKLHYFEVCEDIPYTVLEESKHENNYLVFNFDGKETFDSNGKKLEVHFVVTRYENRPLDKSWREEPQANPEYIQKYLVSNDMLSAGGRDGEEVRRAAGDMESPFARSKVVYEYIIDTMSFDRNGSRWGKRNAVYAGEVSKYNFSDYHSMFINELRSLGIPARFTTGFIIPENRSEGQIDYHCWSQFYIEGKGWLPVDFLEASEHKEPGEYFAVVDENRAAFTIGRDIKLPGSSDEAVIYSIYPYVEINGKSFGGVKTRISFKDVPRQEI